MIMPISRELSTVRSLDLKLEVIPAALPLSSVERVFGSQPCFVVDNTFQKVYLLYHTF